MTEIFFTRPQYVNNEKWNTIRHGVMHDLVKAKFMQNEEMARELIQTGNRKLGEIGKGSDYAIGVPIHSSQCA